MTADDARGADSPPFYGGDGIINQNNTAACTGGFNVKNASGSPYMLTGRPLRDRHLRYNPYHHRAHVNQLVHRRERSTALPYRMGRTGN